LINQLIIVTVVSYRPVFERSSSVFFSTPDPFAHGRCGAKLNDYKRDQINYLFKILYSLPLLLDFVYHLNGILVVN
jgi:hypothetical protein